MKIEFIKEQIASVNKWTNNIILDIPNDDFGIVEELGTSVNWQLGHIIISNYFHAIQSILNKDHEILLSIRKNVPIDDMFNYYFAWSNPLANWKDRPDKEMLLKYKDEMDQAILKTLGLFNAKELEEPTSVTNPIARSKYQALTFTFKHQMWHNGQLAMMKRIIKQKND